jgi:hypothetical protein
VATFGAHDPIHLRSYPPAGIASFISLNATRGNWRSQQSCAPRDDEVFEVHGYVTPKYASAIQKACDENPANSEKRSRHFLSLKRTHLMS